jgi:hypothetical protein
VFKEVHNTWPAKNGKPAGESYDLLCMDISNPPEHRMEEMLYYRTKEDERPEGLGQIGRQHDPSGRVENPPR